MELENGLQDIVVIYHAHCQDGFGSAFSAYQKFGMTASYIPCSDRIVPPEGLTDKEIYILDFSYPKEVLLDLEAKNKKLVVIDHHISSEGAVSSVKEHIFSNEHSGAYLSWEYFVGGVVPSLIKYLEVIDLAKDKNNEDVDLITYILSKPYDFRVYQAMLEDFEQKEKLPELIRIGEAQNEYLNLIIDAIIDDPDFVEFEGYTIPCINAHLPINEKSIALAKLYTKYPPFVMSYRFDDGLVKVSLRGNGEVDLAELAMKYGGGGHRNSCGFVLPMDAPLPFAKAIKKDSLLS